MRYTARHDQDILLMETGAVLSRSVQRDYFYLETQTEVVSYGEVAI